jgi:hypothetical protein
VTIWEQKLEEESLDFITDSTDYIEKKRINGTKSFIGVNLY